MIRNTSYRDKEVREEIDLAVGRPYGIVSRIRMGGIGSPRILVENASPNLWKYFHKNQSARHCNIEIRPRGIIIHFRYIMDVMSWVIPWHHLIIYSEGTSYTIHSNGEFMRIMPAWQDSSLSHFIEKLIRIKSDLSLGDPGQ